MNGRRAGRPLALLLVLACPASTVAQQPDSGRALPGPPIRAIATAAAVSADALGSVGGVRELPDGRLLVRDGSSRRLLLMDSALKTLAVVLDSTTGVANGYGSQSSILIPFRGDSTLFVDPDAYAMRVIDPAGRLVRVRSVWRVADLLDLQMGRSWPGTDARGRIVYRVRAQPPRQSVVRLPGGIPFFPSRPDSAYIVAADVDTRHIDTVGVIRIPRSDFAVRRLRDGRFEPRPVVDPLPATDEWAVLADGTVAFVRGRDYRVDYLDSDGRLTSSPRLPYPWQRLSDQEKERLVDSTRTTLERQSIVTYVTSMIAWANQNGGKYPAAFKVPDRFSLPPGLPRKIVLPPGLTFPPGYLYRCGPGEQPSGDAAATGSTPGAAKAAPACAMGPPLYYGRSEPPQPQGASVVSASELPDYRPPIAAGAVRADADGNLWIQTLARPIPGTVVFDVVSRAGELVDRLRIPPGYTVVGFGKGKVVYLSMRDAAGVHLTRVRLR